MCRSGGGNCTAHICCREKVLVLNHVELFFPHKQRKNPKKSVYVSVKTYLLVALVVLLWLILRCTGNLQPFWRSAPCQLYRPLFLQCLIFILVALCRCIQGPNAIASDGLQPWQAWSSDCVCRHTQPWRLGSGLGGNHPLRNA